MNTSTQFRARVHFFALFFEAAVQAARPPFIRPTLIGRKKDGVPTGIRTPVPTVKGSCPRPPEIYTLSLHGALPIYR